MKELILPKNSHALANAATVLRKLLKCVAAFARTWLRIPKGQLFQRNQELRIGIMNRLRWHTLPRKLMGYSILSFGVVAGICLSLAQDSSAGASNSAFPYSEYSSDAVTRGSLRSVLVPLEDIRLSSAAAGVIARYHLEEGDSLKAGDVILELDSEIESSVVDEVTARVNGAKADFERVQKNYERAKALREDNINSQKQYEEAKYSLAMAESRYQQSLANLAMAEVRLRERFIRSPIDGIFLKKSKSVGESVERLETVARVVDASRLMLVVYCGTSLFGQIEKEANYPIELLDGRHRGKRIEGKVIHLDPIVDPSTGTFRVKLGIAPGDEVAAGFAARLIPNERSVKVSELATP